jgi:hypothetical protein
MYILLALPFLFTILSLNNSSPSTQPQSYDEILNNLTGTLTSSPLLGFTAFFALILLIAYCWERSRQTN